MSNAKGFHQWRTTKARGAKRDALLLEAADEVQMNASLRFDGYAWLDANRMKHPADLSEPWQERFDRDGSLPRDDSEAMALAFTLQRAAGRGEYLIYGPMYRLWRSVLLLTIPLPVPPRWLPRTIDPSFGDVWTREFMPHLADAERCVREVHERMRYAAEEPFARDPAKRDFAPLLRSRRAKKV